MDAIPKAVPTGLPLYPPPSSKWRERNGAVLCIAEPMANEALRGRETSLSSFFSYIVHLLIFTTNLRWFLSQSRSIG